MKAVAVLLVLVALFAAVFAGSDNTGVISGGISLQANTNVSDGGSSINFRDVTYVSLGDFIFYASIEASEQSSGNSAEVSADGIAGVVIVPSFLAPIPPTSFSLYFNESAAATSFSGLGDITGISASGSFSTAGSIFLKVDEVDSSGTVVGTTELSSTPFGNGQTSVDSTGNVHSTVWTATFSSFSVSFAAIVSQVAGILSTGGAPITPKSLETVIEFNSITYKSAGNHLRLTVLTVAAQGSVSATVSTHSVVVGEAGVSQPYVHFSGQVVVQNSGSSDYVNTGATVTVSADTTNKNNVASEIQGLVSASADIREVTIDFPAGVTSISYDPSVGFDAAIYSASSALVAPVALIFFSAFFLLFL